MNKSQFIDAVAEKAELTRAAAARVVDAIFDTAKGAISEAVHTAGSLSIPGFGKFTRRTRAPRSGRNPRTGTEIKIPERTTVGFSAGRGLKEQRSTSRRKAGAAAGTGAKKTTAGKPAAAASTAKAPAKATAARSTAAKSAAAKSTAKAGGAAKTTKSAGGAKAGAAKSGAAKAGGAKGGNRGS